jgi:hypothetical protein
MIYIINHSFTVGVSIQQPLRGGSVLQQLQENKKPRQNEIFPLEQNHKYKIVRIRPSINNQIKVLIYEFLDMNTNSIVSKEFYSAYDADCFIANASGETQKLKETRESITKSFESNT